MTSLLESIDISLSFNEKNVRICGTFEEPLFVVKDICDILGLTNPTETLRNVDEELKTSVELRSGFSTGIQNFNVVSEAGLYQIIMRCRKEVAKPFQRWVCGEVLPSLRKRGEYRMDEKYQLKLKTLEEENKKLHLLLDKKKRDPKIITEEQFVVYFMKASINEKTVYIIGRTANLNKRFRSYRLKGVLVPEEDIKLVYFRSCRSPEILNLVESNVIMKLSKYLVSGCREVFQSNDLTEKQMSDKIKDAIDFFINSFDDVSENITIEKKDKVEENRIKAELYLETNNDEVNRKRREERSANPEKIRQRELAYWHLNPEKKAEKGKRYYDNHKEEISVKQKEYVQKNSEKIAVRRANYQKDNKEKISEYQKAYKEKNKDELSEKKKKMIRCCVCESILTKQCWSVHSKSKTHLSNMENYPDRKKEFIIVEENSLSADEKYSTTKF
jgi:prophage antirepressor-like protein